MNKIKYLLIVLVAVSIYSCDVDDFDNPPAPPSYNNVAQAITNGIDNPVVTLLKENEDLAWDTLVWTAAQLYEGQGLITHYSVQVADSGSNFSSYFVIEASTTSETSIIITEGNLNTKLLANGYSPVQTYDLQLRIKAFVHEDLDSLFTDPLSFTVTTYKDVPVPDELYIFGSATTVGYDAGSALATYKEDGKFTVFTYLENNKMFRFLMEQDTVDNTYNYESLVNLPDNVASAGDEMKNFTFTGATGWYKIEADYLTSTLIIETYEHNGHTYVEDYDQLYLVGSISGWDAQANPPQFEMTKLSEGVFTYEIVLPDEAQFKFVIGNGEWSPNWANIGGMGNSGILGPEGKNDNITFDGGGDTYKIVVNIKQGTYTIKAANIWLVGSINGWNNHGQYLAALGNNIHVGYQYLDDASEIKILVERDSWDGLWGAGASPGEIADGGGNIIVSGLPTYSTPGFYEIKFDMFNKTVVLTKTDWGVIGDAQAGSWDTDVNLTYNSTNKVWEGQVDFLASGSYKFRANDGWDINLGGSLDNLINGSPDNLATPGAGTYDVTLDLSGTDKFFATVTAVK
ncbi:MAG TPA: hypothetical protein DCG75_08975 [Bacteroidales bacterium]|nr:hypothetical protein [Bacteroidales bacterium]